ncbi:hypothetical protein HGRIS_000015 [Hohenbuehelia grisea]|uniref:Non-specific serine/threonine protein kinase n=1 Tax=Hohenbuehelia grisea TaxID=104357 RepID=A0ABR3JPT2_9AGAR
MAEVILPYSEALHATNSDYIFAQITSSSIVEMLTASSASVITNTRTRGLAPPTTPKTGPKHRHRPLVYFVLDQLPDVVSPCQRSMTFSESLSSRQMLRSPNILLQQPPDAPPIRCVARWVMLSQTNQLAPKCSITLELFGVWQSQYHLAPGSEAFTAFVDRTLESTAGTIVVLREDKKDIDAGGEVYMQVARAYDMYRQGRDTIGGAPAFLVCVLGPILIVAGGFYDGFNTLVEPLTRPCYMLADETGRRQQDLARVLYALYRGIQSLKMQQQSHELQMFRPLTPRVYLDCAPMEGQESLGSLKDFEPSRFAHRLIFSATLARPSSEPERVFVKLVTRPYGEKVHEFLARRGYAPRLYGRKVLDGVPTAYVMEHLGSSWVSLYDLSKGDNSGILRSQAVRDDIKLRIDGIISILQEAAMVHGDLRANNIMIRLDDQQQPVLLGPDSDDVTVKVVDFDWAGEAGVVQYPASRNEDIRGIRWPGLPGDLIEVQHDRELFESWWPSFSSL